MGLHEVLQEIERLGQSRRLIPAEQVIMSALLSLDPFLAPGLTDEALSEIQAKLLQLYNANQSEFSIQCSLFIASKLLVTYQLSKNPQVWDLFSLAISKNCTTVIMAAGFICRRIGDRFKAQLPRLAEHLLKQKANVEYAAAYCLRGMFKSRSSVMSNYIPQTIEFCRRVLALSKQATTVAVIKLLKILVRFSETNVTQVLGCVRMLMKEDQIPFIKNELSMLIARIAFEPLGVVKAKTPSDENEWALDGKASAESGEMAKALEVIEMFPNLLNMTFRHFLELLSPEMYERSHAVLYQFVRSKCNQLMSNFVVMLPRDVRYTYFCEAGKEAASGEQLRLLNALCPDNELNEAAGVALLLASSDDKGSRDAALEFFASFSKSHPSATLSYLRSALAWLSSPPSDDARLQANIRGNSALVYTILSNLPRMEDALVSNEELVMELVSNTFRSGTHNTQLFTGVLWILSVLPDKFVVKDMMSQALKKGVALLATLGSSAEVAEVIDALLAFQSKHLFVGELFDLMKVALSHSSKLSLASIAAISELGPLSGAMSLELVKMILFTAYSINPTGETMKEMISRNLPTGFDLLKISQPMSMEKRHEQESLVRIVNAFPALLNALVESDRQQIYDLLMRGQIINSTVHLLLLSICRSPFPMPKDTLAVLLRLLESNNISQLEIISECVAYFCAKNRPLIPTVFKVVEKQMSRSSCILLSSLFTHVNVPKDVLSRAMVFLSSSVTNGELVPFAMHAFSSALLTHSIQMSSLRASANQLGLLFQILHTTVSMQPVALRLCSECFTLIIEDLSGDLTTKGGSLKDLVNLILRTIEFTPISYAREMYFECSRSILTFCHSLSNIAPINFPLYSGVPSELQMVASETFTEALHFQHLYLAISQLTNPLLMLLQRTGDHRVADFLTVLATTSGDDSLSFWVSTLRRVLSENSLVTSDTPIEPVAAVKVCCLAIAKAVLPKLAEKMVFAGNEYESVEKISEATGIVVGHVLECEMHPESKKLHICKVDLGNEVVQILCGAPNMRQGIKVPVATVGAKLPNGMEIKKAKLAGMDSNGMCCSLEELGIESKYMSEEDKTGIHVLPDDAPVGADAIHYMGYDDEVIDFELTANRGDLLSVLGMAHEIGAIYNRPVTYPENQPKVLKENINDNMTIDVQTENCPIYLGKIVKDVVIKDSPEWMKERLMASGIRSINNVVDISNYVMLEYGQPLHFFDKDRLGDKVIVRMAEENEKLKTLDGQERTLKTSDIVIANEKEAVALAGVMGGLSTEVEMDTKNIFVEAAIFEPIHIRYTAKSILRSEASSRYEKGIDPNRTKEALNRACYLLEKYADGKVYDGI